MYKVKQNSRLSMIVFIVIAMFLALFGLTACDTEALTYSSKNLEIEFEKMDTYDFTATFSITLVNDTDEDIKNVVLSVLFETDNNSVLTQDFEVDLVESNTSEYFQFVFGTNYISLEIEEIHYTDVNGDYLEVEADGGDLSEIFPVSGVVVIFIAIVIAVANATNKNKNKNLE